MPPKKLRISGAMARVAARIEQIGKLEKNASVKTQLERNQSFFKLLAV